MYYIKNNILLFISFTINTLYLPVLKLNILHRNSNWKYWKLSSFQKISMYDDVTLLKDSIPICVRFCEIYQSIACAAGVEDGKQLFYCYLIWNGKNKTREKKKMGCKNKVVTRWKYIKCPTFYS